MGEETYVTEVPSGLRKLARLVVRGFYSIEDTLIIDMLVRNPCMKEDDICELLRFEKKMLRARIATLKNDKFIQVRLRMETGEDGKAQKVNYYFINYKTFVNVVKYKLDLMRKRMETEERDATSRASFKCPKCSKTFTDLEADQLFDCMTGEFMCTYCREVVEEDLSALPKKDCRLQMAKFNSQMEPVFDLLRQVEGIRLAPELLEPEPVDINTIRGVEGGGRPGGPRGPGGPGGEWSGEATRGQGFLVEEATVSVSLGETTTRQDTAVLKERPVWLTDSTVVPTQQAETVVETISEGGGGGRGQDDIMSVLLAHEKRASEVTQAPPPPADPSDSEPEDLASIHNSNSPQEVELIDSEEEELVPKVVVGCESVPLNQLNDALIAQMTPQEKEAYIQVYQEYYSHMYD